MPTAMEGMVCDKGNGGFRFGSDLDVIVTGDEGLKEIEADSGHSVDEVSCFGSPRNVVRKGTRSATVPTFTTRTNLYAAAARTRDFVMQSLGAPGSPTGFWR
ncbi:hypothetical protein [Streptomyces sp. NPDC002209]|uniref:hypothetical protein n=1 Tax=Streptomyces sp. NPDC002209 TaxID=3364638 RepID=UPI0036B06805